MHSAYPAHQVFLCAPQGAVTDDSPVEVLIAQTAQDARAHYEAFWSVPASVLGHLAQFAALLHSLQAPEATELADAIDEHEPTLGEMQPYAVALASRVALVFAQSAERAARLARQKFPTEQPGTMYNMEELRSVVQLLQAASQPDAIVTVVTPSSQST